MGKIAAVAAALGCSMSAAAYYTFVYAPLEEAEDAELIIPDEHLEITEKFVHPMDNSPWFWRMLFRVQRILYLTALFVPCVAVSAVMHFSEEEYWRKYWLEVLVQTLEAAGCSFQKFGQWLSMRPDMFPADMIAALSKLRDDVPTHGFEHTRKMILESFGCEIEEIFEEFDEESIASGTVAQVHRAVLKPEYAEAKNIRGPGGELLTQVAVKVRHPRVLEESWMDVDIIFAVIDHTDILTVPFSKEDFMSIMQKQIDFKCEARNLHKFAKNFEKEISDGIFNFPAVPDQLVSSSVLVESWASGEAISELFSTLNDNVQELVAEAKNKAKGVTTKYKKQIANSLFDMNMKMFLRDNFVHGDLHAGNILVDPENQKCTVLDAGLTTTLRKDIKPMFSKFVHDMCVGDADGVSECLLEFDEHRGDVHTTRREEFMKDIRKSVGKFVKPGTCATPEGGVISLGDIIGDVCFTLQRYQISLRGDIASTLMSMSVSEGLIVSLDPDFDVVKRSLPYLIRFNGWENSD